MLELTKAELKHVMSIYAKGTPIEAQDGGAVWGKLCAELERLEAIEARQAAEEARREQEERNRAYATGPMKIGDIVTFTVYETSGYRSTFRSGENTYTVRLTQIGQHKERFSGEPSGKLNLDGVVLTKSGQPHKTLNRNGYRSFYGVHPTRIILVTAAE